MGVHRNTKETTLTEEIRARFKEEVAFGFRHEAGVGIYQEKIKKDVSGKKNSLEVLESVFALTRWFVGLFSFLLSLNR